MTQLLPSIDLPRPAPAADAGPLDAPFYDLVEARTRRVFADNPVLASYWGIHDFDHLLGDSSRDAVLHEVAADREHLAAVEALDPAELSAGVRFERDLEIHNLRLAQFQNGEVRQWERRSTAAGELGDAIFSLFARGARPPRRAPRPHHRTPGGRHRPTSRLRTRARPGRRWRRGRRSTSATRRTCRRLFAEVRAAAAGILPAGDLRHLDAAIAAASGALEEHTTWIDRTLEHATDDWPLGGERYDELLRRRAFDDLDTDAILEIGWEQLRRNHEGRRAAARELDPDADDATVIERLKTDHPATFEDALDAYKDTMRRARSYLLEHDLVTIPEESIEVIPTPEYLRSVMPFAAYFSPARFDADKRGIYIVTPAVDDDPNAMREHYYGSISNTSIHEAYPGHHLQFAVADLHPSLTRMLTEAPEFVEGWGMYSEQMMREEGFDAGPTFRAAMYTDAIWRSCRIILDVRMHRGELTTDEATDFLVEHTSFEVSNATAEVRRYTYTPGYQLSYLLGKVLILGLREEEKRRLGERFSLKAFHDTLLGNGSIPISFHRRLLQAGNGGRWT